MPKNRELHRSTVLLTTAKGRIANHHILTTGLEGTAQSRLTMPSGLTVMG